MATLALTILRPLLPYILCFFAFLGVYLWADQGWHNGVAQRAEKRAVAAEAKLAELDKQRIQQQERWAQQTAAEEVRAKQQESDRAKAFAGRAAAAKADSAMRGIAITDTTKRMLGDAYAAATTAGTTGKPEEAAPADSKTLADLTAWSVEILEWASVCQDRVTRWEMFYNGLRQ